MNNFKHQEAAKLLISVTYPDPWWVVHGVRLEREIDAAWRKNDALAKRVMGN